MDAKQLGAPSNSAPGSVDVIVDKHHMGQTPTVSPLVGCESVSPIRLPYDCGVVITEFNCVKYVITHQIYEWVDLY